MRANAAPVLRVRDARVAIAWWARLGFQVEFEHRFEPHLPLYVGLRRDDAIVHLSEHAGDARAPGLVYVYVPDIDRIAAEFGVSVDEAPWAREVQLVDPDHNRVRCGCVPPASDAPQPQLRVSTVNLSAADVPGLSRFYAQLLGYAVDEDNPDWHYLAASDGSVALSVQHEPTHLPPVWPQSAEAQQMQAHLEIRVDGDLGAAVDRAIALGATLAAYQPQDDVRVLLDPAGHPFCLWVPS